MQFPLRSNLKVLRKVLLQCIFLFCFFFVASIFCNTAVMQSVIDMNRQTDGDTQLDFYESMGHFKTMFPTMEEEVRVTIVYCSVLISII